MRVMPYPVLEGLEPEDFFYWFGVISKIPRGSRKEGQFIAFLQRYAKERGLPCETDQAGNVMIRVPAAPGHEDRPPVLLQAHMDMVWTTVPGKEFDFETQGIEILRKDDLLVGDGTTLGADNGVGLAVMLALGDNLEIKHPPLELLFTVEEEIGLKGIRKFDYAQIQSRRMLNMDCGYSHIVGVSSAGSAPLLLEKEYRPEPVADDAIGLAIKISGCTGGHSGLMIYKEGACAGNLTGALLTALEPFAYRVSKLESLGKAILKGFASEILIPAASRQAVEEVLRERFAQQKQEYERTDPDMALEIREVPVGTEALSVADSRNVGRALFLLVTGPIRSRGDDRRILITSGNIIDANLQDGHLAIRYGLRSSSDFYKMLCIERIRMQMEALELEVQVTDCYPGWGERVESPFRDLFLAEHRRICGFDAELERVHGGIEVGMIVGAIPEMDAVGYAPTARGAHTPEEWMSISEVKPFWDVLLAVLEKC
ncbi:MAG: M20/M25/M40 family metallo-hydrolase [Clostridia bacterium]|nr:M20/M25/M40 family metallo-hydrolase [Clostridia bacterium]